MKKNNVKCLHCGREEYNPNIPQEHTIDCCSDQKCIEKSQGMSIGFKNGNTLDCSIVNLYRVKTNYLRVEKYQRSYTLETDMLAKVKFHISQENYSTASKLLRNKEVSDLPEAVYLRSKIFFYNQKNNQMCVKLLKESSILGYPMAKAEYGYIITMGKYGSRKQPDEGIKLLLEAYEEGSILASAYLADVYKSGPKESSEYQNISDEKWFEIVSFSAKMTQDPMAQIVTGYFYYYGIGTDINYAEAYSYLKAASNQDYVIAQHLFVDLVLNPFSGIQSKTTLDEAYTFCERYLHNATHKDSMEYHQMESNFIELKNAIELLEE